MIEPVVSAYSGRKDPPSDICDEPSDKPYCVAKGQVIGRVADWEENSHLHFALNTGTYQKRSWGYVNIKESTKSGCSKDSVRTRREELADQGWLDPAVVGLDSGWAPFILEGGLGGDCNAPRQVYLPFPYGNSLPYYPWFE